MHVTVDELRYMCYVYNVYFTIMRMCILVVKITFFLHSHMQCVSSIRCMYLCMCNILCPGKSYFTIGIMGMQ